MKVTGPVTVYWQQLGWAAAVISCQALHQCRSLITQISLGFSLMVITSCIVLLLCLLSSYPSYQWMCLYYINNTRQASSPPVQHLQPKNEEHWEVERDHGNEMVLDPPDGQWDTIEKATSQGPMLLDNVIDLPDKVYGKTFQTWPLTYIETTVSQPWLFSLASHKSKQELASDPKPRLSLYHFSTLQLAMLLQCFTILYGFSGRWESRLSFQAD